MSQQWFYRIADTECGPVHFTELRRMVTAGALPGECLVWTQGMAQWSRADSIYGIDQSASGTTPGIPVGASGAYPALPTPWVYAGFWLRAVAALIDAVIMLVIVLAVGLLSTKPLLRFLSEDPDRAAPTIYTIFFALLAFSWLYFAVSESGDAQATPGKDLLGLQVTDLDGQRLTFTRASMRYFAKYISRFPLYFGFIMAGFTSQKQAMHDKLTGCLVLKTGRLKISGRG